MPAPAPTRALLLADTHLTGATLHRLPAEVWSMAEQADVVVHAGDVVDRDVLTALEARAPVHAVRGNNDRDLPELPEVQDLRLGPVRVAVVHDAGPTAGRHRRMARRFPAAEVVVFGHSHAPVVAREGDGPLLVNPGSPVQRRRQPVHTVAWLHLAPGAPTAEVVEVGPLAAQPG